MAQRVEQLVQEFLDPAIIKPWKHNPRIHSKKQINQVAESIKEFGFINGIVIDGDGNIVAGAARYWAALELGLKQIPVIRLSHLNEAQLRAYRIADNKLAENSEWDEDNLRHEVVFLAEAEFNVELTGFEAVEIDVLVNASADDVAEARSLAALDKDAEVIVRQGDIFWLGNHRIICGDCRDKSVMDKLMQGELASAVFSDAPYNVRVNGHVATRPGVHEEFAHASGEMTSEEFVRFLRDSFQPMADCSKDGSVHFQCMDWRHEPEIRAAGEAVYDDLLNVCIWAKNNAGMGSLYRSQYEQVHVFKKGKAKHLNNVQLGKNGRNRSNLWSYNGMNSFGAGRDELLASHPTVKPLQMVADAILDVTRPGEIVLDGFLGSGTTLLAAHQTGRIGYGCEISPQYVEVAINRFRAISDEPVIHEETGLAFDDLREQRLQDAAQEVSDV